MIKEIDSLGSFPQGFRKISGSGAPNSNERAWNEANYKGSSASSHFKKFGARLSTNFLPDKLGD